MFNRIALCCHLLLLVLATAQAKIFSSDVCVYGATSGGVVAAVQTARMGKTVTLADPGRHAGGMTSGGLGWVDFGNKEAIGGMSLEFIHRVAARYPGLPASEWKQGEGWTFEPHVAEAVFNDMLAEEKVAVHFGEELAEVKQHGKRITEITMANGDIFRAKMFIDATYEGDLMAGARVSYTTARESNERYHETVNGIRVKLPSFNGADLQIDPFVVPGDPSSGLLPLIQTGDPGTDGAAGPADSAQAFNYRLCLTQNPANRLPIDPPPDYNAATYELFARFIAAARAKNIPLALKQDPKKNLGFLKIDPLPNGKTDVNNGGWFSTDFIGASSGYAAADHATRKTIAKKHENYIRGLLHFLATDPRVPEEIRTPMQSWGLCRDEFQDNGGWPFQLYVRESRRIIGAYVMTEHDCRRETTLADSIGLGSYAMDSHSFRRLVWNGAAATDGGFYAHLDAPYAISYGAITPKGDECENLLVPACCSASHAAYASLRMEPVFMILGQSAATATAIAIDDDIPVQKVDIKKLQARLLQDKQLL